ncbi:hypothetical protein [Corynebacterium pseudodiphtheriticum]|uniref:hypothetical protein n=1 Tax=Corynebacterium pseudodiphtheriticum TaxID=37637 RepID=UPI0025410509|nr:hypothetical protein [Corynebacterium pseudodiphtheriticum]MDK4286974.1 hypothetical protein [Corynebacterium pseudodiphtheriticum]
MKETHADWCKRVTRGDSNRHVSSRAKISDATLGRQLKANELSADLIIKIAQAYNESPVVALVDLGFVSARWLQEIGTTTALTRASDEELTDELLRRLRLLDDQPIDDLAARREGVPVSGPRNDGVVSDLDYSPLRDVADTSPEEGDGSPDDYEP